MNRSLLIVGLLLILMMPQAWGSPNLPDACKGVLNSSITGFQNLFNSPAEAQKNAWDRCNRILAANQAAQVRAHKAKMQAWAQAQNSSL